METRLFIFVLISFGFNANGQESDCRTSDGGVGICKPITECPSMLEKATAFASAHEPLRQTIQNELRKSYCGYANENWKVCCSECKTPDGKSGLLKYIRNCPHLWNLLTGRTPQGLIYVRDSRVNNQSLDVCCGPDPSSSDCNSQITALPPDPSTRCCGIDIHAGSRIAGGKTTDIDEYPWTVLLEYELKGEIKLFCGGSLISNRYVLTAAHCITGDDAWPPKNVRVGEFDTLNTGRDCVLLADGGQDCTDGAESIPIDSITVHSEYEVATHRNDIALIRLRDPVRYTEFVRPICLPTSESVAQDLTVVGWGKVNMTHRSRHKQSLRVRLVDGQDCQNTYKNSAPLWDKQICAGGEAGKDSCNGDSGGPLMGEVNPNEPRFELAGLVSFGPKRCGTAGKPGIYTNVYKYLDWIRANMRQ